MTTDKKDEGGNARIRTNNWSKGADSLPTGGELKEMVNLVLDDEFPLNVFYETLNRNLREVIDSTAGITS